MMNDTHRHYAEPESTVISMQFSNSQKLIYGERMQNEAEGGEGDWVEHEGTFQMMKTFYIWLAVMVSRM